jgi:hypothetical protein
MKLRALIFLGCLCAFACVAKDSTEEDLINAMRTYLYNGVNNDSTNVKYYIEKVIYYNDKNRGEYICEFTVHLKERMFDTTGIMKAYISKDFKTVKRLY